MTFFDRRHRSGTRGSFRRQQRLANCQTARRRAFPAGRRGPTQHIDGAWSAARSDGPTTPRQSPCPGRHRRTARCTLAAPVSPDPRGVTPARNRGAAVTLLLPLTPPPATMHTASGLTCGNARQRWSSPCTAYRGLTASGRPGDGPCRLGAFASCWRPTLSPCRPGVSGASLAQVSGTWGRGDAVPETA